MIIEGKVVSGLGVAKIWIKKIEKNFLEKTGKKMFLGTLNLELDYEYTFKPDIIIYKHEYGGEYDVHIKKCKIFDDTAYIVRSGKNMQKNGDYKLNIIEVMSEVNFRDKYKLIDGQSVKCLV